MYTNYAQIACKLCKQRKKNLKDERKRQITNLKVKKNINMGLMIM